MSHTVYTKDSLAIVTNNHALQLSYEKQLYQYLMAFNYFTLTPDPYS